MVHWAWMLRQGAVQTTVGLCCERELGCRLVGEVWQQEATRRWPRTLPATRHPPSASTRPLPIVGSSVPVP